MAGPCIISVAITGSLPRKANNPAVPITIAEQVESTQEAFEAGAAIVARARAQRRRDAHLRPGALRPAARGPARALPRA